MRALVVYFSKFGHTQMVAEAIAEALASKMPVDVAHLDELNEADLNGVGLIVMGTPTHNMNLPKAVRPLLDAFPRRALKGIAFAAFDTSYRLSWWLRPFTAAKRLSRKLRKLGGVRVVPPETFHVMEREGPLYEGEIERAAVWTDLILGRLAARDAGSRRVTQHG